MIIEAEIVLNFNHPINTANKSHFPEHCFVFVFFSTTLLLWRRLMTLASWFLKQFRQFSALLSWRWRLDDQYNKFMALKYAFIWNYKGETLDQYTILPLTTILRKITKKKKRNHKCSKWYLTSSELEWKLSLQFWHGKMYLIFDF